VGFKDAVLTAVLRIVVSIYIRMPSISLDRYECLQKFFFDKSFRTLVIYFGEIITTLRFVIAKRACMVDL
jgi:hypothetical protein